MPQQNSSSQNAPESNPAHPMNPERGQKPQPPSAENPATSSHDQPPTQEAVVRNGNLTYEAFADHYFVQGP